MRRLLAVPNSTGPGPESSVREAAGKAQTWTVAGEKNAATKARPTVHSETLASRSQRQHSQQDGTPERGVPRFSPSQPCLVCHTSVYLWVFYPAIVLQNEKSGVLIQRQTSRGGDFPLWGMDPQSGKGLVMALGEFEAALPGGERIVL